MAYFGGMCFGIIDLILEKRRHARAEIHCRIEMYAT